MTDAVHDPVRDVTLLMMVRLMPDDDFNRLCETICPGSNTKGSTLDGGRCSVTLGHSRSDTETRCDCCGAEIERVPETDNFAEATGLPACKACVDAALGAFFGADIEARQLARQAFSLIAASHA